MQSCCGPANRGSLLTVLACFLVAVLFIDSIEININVAGGQKELKGPSSVASVDDSKSTLESQLGVVADEVILPASNAAPPNEEETTSTEDHSPNDTKSEEEETDGNDASNPIPQTELVAEKKEEPAPTPQATSVETEPAQSPVDDSPRLPFLTYFDEPGYKKDPRQLSDTYIPRGKPIDEAMRRELAEKWGSWTFEDSKAGSRPSDDFYAAFPNRDVPRDKFPLNAWQLDEEYLSKFLPQAKALVTRAMESILTEYGHGPFDLPEQSLEERSQMFSLEIVETLTGSNDRGGTITQKSFDGLVRRILHAIMTEDTFVFGMGGHSSAAGHGNHIQQTYTMQVQKVLEPVFARLGVYSFARNIAYGGMGTLQTGLAMGSLLGDDLDVLMWDSGMTEKEPYALDIFFRQALIGGNKVPVLSGGHHGLMNIFAEEGADVFAVGSGSFGVQRTTDILTVESLPWAVQWLNCESDLAAECRAHAYIGKCWFDRSDFVPTTPQAAEPGGRASWHPGNRVHQLTGRVIAFDILQALNAAIDKWMDFQGFVLPDEMWHVSTYYNTIQQNVLNMDADKGYCHQLDPHLSARICNVPMRAATEFTPRPNPAKTSIRALLHPDMNISKPKPNVYDPPDIRIATLDVPDGVFEYLAVVENGNPYTPNRARLMGIQDNVIVERQAGGNAAIQPGLGFTLGTIAAADNCDGTYDQFCNRGADQTCLLYGHPDARGGIMFDGFSGWLKMTLPDVKHGIIMIKMHDWLPPGYNEATAGWQCENNATDCASARVLTESNLRGSLEPRKTSGRRLEEYCEDFIFQFAIDGIITTWDKAEFIDVQHKPLQRVVQLWTLLDDPNYNAGQPKDVDFAIRMLGCGRSKTFSLTHIYWA